MQEAWATLASAGVEDLLIMDGSVCKNVVFGLHFEEEKYRATVHACGLNIDFEHFRDGDAMIVSDRGVQCSSGQHARISLARALYMDANKLVADNSLLAVDVKVGSVIYHLALHRMCTARSKCVILATHQYMDADILVANDHPLSAVDETVGSVIYHLAQTVGSVIYHLALHRMCMVRDKCVILATHQHQFMIWNETCELMEKGGKHQW